MKKIFTLFILLSFFSFVFVACSSRDDSSSSSGYIQVNAEKINIDNVNVHEKINSNGTNSNEYIFIFTNIGKSNNGIRATKTVQLGIELPTTEQLNGDFNFKSNTRKISYASTWYMDFDGSNGVSKNILSEGKCSIERKGENNFTVRFSFNIGEGESVTGEYSGRVILHNGKN
ncbi:hypothetical protein [Elizabethkingia meningoseptica]|uniref:hypothetical protein n=1 Tax=Elizabethkingia meningoseptica TaxID=238 RepID=UPI0038915878